MSVVAGSVGPASTEGKHLIEHWVHATLERDRSSKELLYLIQNHVGFGQELPKEVRGFCFPDQEYVAPSKDAVGLFYTFVLTDMAGTRMYGFCRRVLPPVDTNSVGYATEFRYPHVLCLITYWPWFDVFAQLLEVIEECVWVKRAHLSLDSLLDAIRNHPVPPPGAPLDRVPFPTTELRIRIKLIRPPPKHEQPLCGMNAQELLEVLSVDNLVAVFLAMLCERRVLLTSSNLARLSTCAHALISLAYPFEWQHIFIPLIPKGMLSYCTAPMPFFIGAHTSSMPSIRRMPLERVLFVDLDTNSVSSGGDDGGDDERLPPSLDKWVTQALRQITVQYVQGKRSCEPFNYQQLTQVFQYILFHLTVGYWNFFGINSKGLFRFDRDTFVAKKSKDIRSVVRHFCESQMFERWIVGRERLAEQGVPAKDDFEHELRAFAKQNPLLEVSRETPVQTKTNVKDRLLASINKQKKKYRAAQAAKNAVPREYSKPTAVSAATISISGPTGFRHDQGLEAASPSMQPLTGVTALRPKRVDHTDIAMAPSAATAAAAAAASGPLTQHPAMRNRVRDPEKINFAVLHAAFDPRHPAKNPLFAAAAAFPERSTEPSLPPSRPTALAAAVPRPSSSNPNVNAAVAAPPKKPLPAPPVPASSHVRSIPAHGHLVPHTPTRSHTAATHPLPPDSFHPAPSPAPPVSFHPAPSPAPAVSLPAAASARPSAVSAYSAAVSATASSAAPRRAAPATPSQAPESPRQLRPAPQPPRAEPPSLFDLIGAFPSPPTTAAPPPPSTSSSPALSFPYAFDVGTPVSTHAPVLQPGTSLLQPQTFGAFPAATPSFPAAAALPSAFPVAGTPPTAAASFPGTATASFPGALPSATASFPGPGTASTGSFPGATTLPSATGSFPSLPTMLATPPAGTGYPSAITGATATSDFDFFDFQSASTAPMSWPAASPADSAPADRFFSAQATNPPVGQFPVAHPAAAPAFAGAATVPSFPAAAPTFTATPALMPSPLPTAPATATAALAPRPWVPGQPFPNYFPDAGPPAVTATTSPVLASMPSPAGLPLSTSTPALATTPASAATPGQAQQPAPDAWSNFYREIMQANR